MFRKLLVGALLIFVAVPAGILVVEHLRGRAQLAAVVAELEGRGEILDPVRLLPPRVPAQSNGLAALIAATQRLSDASMLAPPSVQIVAPGRALSPARLAWWPGDKRTNSWADVENWARRNAEDLGAVHASLLLPVRRADLDFSRGFASMRIQHLSPMKRAAAALALAALESARAGDLEGTVANLSAMVVLDGDLSTEPILITQLVRIACCNIADSSTWAILHAHPWTEPELAQIQAALEGPRYVDATVHSLEGERALYLHDLRHSRSSVLAESWFNDSSDYLGGGATSDLAMPTSVNEAIDFAGTMVSRLVENSRKKVLFPLWRFGWGDQAAAYYLDGMDTLLRAHRAAAASGSAATLQNLNLIGRLTPQSFYERLRTGFGASSIPVFDKASEKAFRAETERSMAVTGIALRRYQLRHHGYPETLEPLVPEFLSTLPVDRMDGRPLRYRRKADGRFTLWSVGQDCKDGDGDGSWDASRKQPPHWWMAHDAVWPDAATDEEVASWQKAEGDKLARAARPTVSGTVSASSKSALSPELVKRYGLMQAGGETNTPPGSAEK